jgi:uncharacterized protein (DUF305 family)
VPQDGGIDLNNMTILLNGINMTKNHTYIRTSGAVLVALAGALLQPLAQAQPAPTSNNSMPAMSGSPSMASGMDLKSMMKNMNDKMSSMQLTGNQDVDFARMMRIHHQGAIDMAEPELRSGKAPAMRKMAKDIIAAQKKEIAQIDKFLAKQGGGQSKDMPSK